MSTKTKPTKKAAARPLESIIMRLEKWQARYGQLDPQGETRSAKSNLLELLRELES